MVVSLAECQQQGVFDGRLFRSRSQGEGFGAQGGAHLVGGDGADAMLLEDAGDFGF